MRPQPRVRNKTKHTSVVTTVTPETPGIPRAMVLTVSFALSSVTGLVCHRRLADTSAKLDASVGASGPHDFAVPGSAPSSEALPTSIASRPASVTIASRPSVGRDDSIYRCFYQAVKRNFGKSEIKPHTSAMSQNGHRSSIRRRPVHFTAAALPNRRKATTPVPRPILQRPRRLMQKSPRSLRATA
jgi:hypothetical protein